MGKISITYNGESILIESGKKNLTITAEQAYYLKEMLSDIDSKYNLRPQIQEMQLLTMLMKNIKLPSPFTTAAKTGI